MPSTLWLQRRRGYPSRASQIDGFARALGNWTQKTKDG